MRLFLLRLIALWCALFLPLAQGGTMLLNPYRVGISGGGGGGSFAFVGSDFTPAGADGGTSDAYDTTGAKLLVVAVHYFATGTIGLTDSKSNTWTSTTARTDGSSNAVQLFYCIGGTVGTGHTFTVTGTQNFATITSVAYSNSGTPTLHSQNGTGAGTQPGAVTPTVNGSLIVVACTDVVTNNNPTGGFTVIRSPYVGTMGATMGHLVQTTAASINPTFDTAGAISILVFNP